MSTLGIFSGSTRPYGQTRITTLKFIRYDSFVIIDYLSYPKLFRQGHKEIDRVGRFSFLEIIVDLVSKDYSKRIEHKMNKIPRNNVLSRNRPSRYVTDRYVKRQFLSISVRSTTSDLGPFRQIVDARIYISANQPNRSTVAEKRRSA